MHTYLQGIAAAHQQKDKALKVIQKYTRLKDQKLIEELYNDSVEFLERVPRLDSEAIAPNCRLHGQKADRRRNHRRQLHY